MRRFLLQRGSRPLPLVATGCGRPACKGRIPKLRVECAIAGNTNALFAPRSWATSGG